MVGQVMHAPARQSVSVDRQALTEEARRKARRRRLRNGAAVLVAVGVGVGVAAFLAFGGHGGGSAGSAAQALGGGRAAGAWSIPAFPHLPPDTTVVNFAFDAGAPGTLYIGAVGPRPNARQVPEGRVYESSDNGRHWRLTTRSHWLPVLTLAADPHQPGAVYAGTARAVLKSVDEGRHWRVVRRWPLSPDPYGFFNRYSLTVDPADSRVIYASGGSGVSRSSDGGHHWKRVLPALGSSDAVFVFAPTRPEVAYVLAANGDHSYLYVLSNGGTSWRVNRLPHAAAANAQGFPGSGALAVDPQNPKTLYAAAGGTAFKSTDAGKHWQSITAGLPPNAPISSLAVDPRHEGTVYAALGGDGIFKTTNSGQTWDQHWFPVISVDILAIDPAHPSTIYAGVSGGNPTASAGSSPQPPLLKSTNNGHTWKPAG